MVFRRGLLGVKEATRFFKNLEKNLKLSGCLLYLYCKKNSTLKAGDTPMKASNTASFTRRQEIDVDNEMASNSQALYATKLPRDHGTRQLIKASLAGYHRMNELTEAELHRDLPTMTEEESRQEYEELWAVWDQTRKYHPDPHGEALLDQLHIAALVERRRLWDKLIRELARKKKEYAPDL
jgi:hypothetical protein